MSWLQDNNLEMYTTDSKEKSVVAEIFIRNLKNKIYKYMISISKNVYIHNLADIVNKDNNTYHAAIKMKPVNVNSRIYIDFNKGNSKENPNLKLVII